MQRNKIYTGNSDDVLKTFPDGSVDCCFASPPYYGVRNYVGPRWEGGQPWCQHPHMKRECRICGAVRVDNEIGIEWSVEKYTSRIISVFEQVRRLLKPHGTLWLNLGDNYSQSRSCIIGDYDDLTNPRWMQNKQLYGIPWRMAFAMQGFAVVPFYKFSEWADILKTARETGDWQLVNFVENILRSADMLEGLKGSGWFLRQEIIWNKPNGLPESVKDRCNKTHEQVFILSKSKNYYFDHVAIMEDAKWTSPTNMNAGDYEKNAQLPPNKKRNRRSVWNINTAGIKANHFAPAPEALLEMIINAAMSFKGYCNCCGKPFKREYKNTFEVEHNGVSETKYDKQSTSGRMSNLRQAARKLGVEYYTELETTGWRQTCKCEGSVAEKGIILDPFMGSGTTGLVAKKKGHDFVGVELSEENVRLSDERLESFFGLFHEPVYI